MTIFLLGEFPFEQAGQNADVFLQRFKTKELVKSPEFFDLHR